jgi:hypothetical protein
MTATRSRSLVCHSSATGSQWIKNRCKSREADARIRTADPFITSEVLYQLSYVGAGSPV